MINRKELGLIIVGKKRPYLIKPMILRPEVWHYHAGLYPLIDAAKKTGDQVVMFGSGPKVRDSTPAGTHDSIRGGMKTGSISWKDNTTLYCLYSRWLAAGGEALD